LRAHDVRGRRSRAPALPRIRQGVDVHLGSAQVPGGREAELRPLPLRARGLLSSQPPVARERLARLVAPARALLALRRAVELRAALEDAELDATVRFPSSA